MNENPWRVDDIARLQRERTREEMRQIRSEERADEAQPYRIGLIARVVQLLARVFAPRQRTALNPNTRRASHAVRAKRPA